MPRESVPTVSFTGSPAEVSFQGVPKWKAEHTLQMLRQARRLAEEKNIQYGLPPAQKAKLDAEIAKLIGLKGNVAPASSIPMSVTGDSEPILFTKEELYKALVDEPFARRLFAETTGNERVSRHDVKDLRDRIRLEHPDVLSVAKDQGDNGGNSPNKKKPPRIITRNKPEPKPDTEFSDPDITKKEKEEIATRYKYEVLNKPYVENTVDEEFNNRPLNQIKIRGKFYKDLANADTVSELRARRKFEEEEELKRQAKRQKELELKEYEDIVAGRKELEPERYFAPEKPRRATTPEHKAETTSQKSFRSAGRKPSKPFEVQREGELEERPLTIREAVHNIIERSKASSREGSRASQRMAPVDNQEQLQNIAPIEDNQELLNQILANMTKQRERLQGFNEKKERSNDLKTLTSDLKELEDEKAKFHNTNAQTFKDRFGNTLYKTGDVNTVRLHGYPGFTGDKSGLSVPQAPIPQNRADVENIYNQMVLLWKEYNEGVDKQIQAIKERIGSLKNEEEKEQEPIKKLPPQEPLPDLNSIKNNMASMRSFVAKAEGQGFPPDTTTNQVVKNTLGYNQKRTTEAYDFMKKKQEAEQAQEKEPSVYSVKKAAEDIINNAENEENPGLALLQQEREQAPQVMVNAANKKEFVLPEFKTMHPSVAPMPLGQARLEASKIKRRALGLEETNDIDPEFSGQQMATSGNISWATKTKQRASQYADYLDAKKKEEEEQAKAELARQEIMKNLPAFTKIKPEFMSHKMSTPEARLQFSKIKRAALGIPEDNTEDPEFSEAALPRGNQNVLTAAKKKASQYADYLESKNKGLPGGSKEMLNEKIPNLENIPEDFEEVAEEEPSVHEQAPQRRYTDLLRRAAIQREVKNLQSGPGSRIAPMNATHSQAKRMLERGFEDDTMDVAREEINEAKKEHIPRTIQPFLNQINDPTGFLDQYRNQYQKRVIDALKDEAKESFFEDELPAINNQFIANNMFHSASRQAAIERAKRDRERHLTREIAKLLSHGEDKAMERAHEHRGLILSAGQTAANAAKAQQEASSRNAQLLALQGAAKHDIAQKDINALQQIAVSEQQQKQNEKNLLVQEFEREKNFPWEQLSRETGIAQGNPVQQTQTYSAQQLGQPMPPNIYNTMGGALGTMMGMQQQQQMAQRPLGSYAKGGHVRAKFAKGGHVDSASSKWNEIGQQVQAAPHDQDIQDIAGEMRNYRVDPVANWMMHTGNAMLANNRGDPLSNIGRGAMSAADAMERGQERMLTAREKAANLYEKINHSRLNQHKVLADFYGREQTRAQSERHHADRLAAQRAALEAKANAPLSESQQLDLEYKKAQIDALKNKSQKQQTKLDPVDKDILQNSNKQLMNAPALMEDLDRLSDLSNEIKTGTASTNIPGLGNPYMQSFLGQGKQENLEEFDKIANDFALKAASAFGGKAGARIAQMFKEAKPHRGMSRKAIQNVVNNIKKQINEEVARGEYINEAYENGISPKKALTTYGKKDKKSDHGISAMSTEELMRIAAA